MHDQGMPDEDDDDDKRPLQIVEQTLDDETSALCEVIVTEGPESDEAAKGCVEGDACSSEGIFPSSSSFLLFFQFLNFRNLYSCRSCGRAGEGREEEAMRRIRR
jgi:hypothetical protein